MLKVHELGKTYGEGTSAYRAVGRVSFDVAEGEFVSVVGPSGCGKTTLLKCISGLLKPTDGSVTLQGAKVAGPPKEMALVFQDYSRSLMPWLTVEGNVELPLRHLKLGKTETLRRVSEAIEAVGLTAASNKYPWQLSGGMQQRVAIARGIAYQPSILIMDEPFASVDAQTRTDLEDLLLEIRTQFGITILFVTHDIDESVYLSDRVVVLSSPPTEVKEVLVSTLPYPRDQVATKELPDFAHLRARVYQLIKRGAEPVADIGLDGEGPLD